MKYLLDTDICIYLIKRKPSHLIERVRGIAVGDIGISIITLCELEYGAEKSSNPDRNREALHEFVLPLTICELSWGVALEYARTRHALEKQPIGIHDLLIASQALQLGVILVTNNLKEFRRVPGLAVQNWSRP